MFYKMKFMQNLQEILPWLEQPLFFELNPFTQFAGGGEGGGWKSYQKKHPLT